MTSIALVMTAPARSRSFARTARLMLACVILGFPAAYFKPIATGSPHFSPFYLIHGATFFGWMFLYAWQTQLAAQGRIARHRELGLAANAGAEANALPVAGFITALDGLESTNLPPTTMQ